jgi:hypothetical protein
LTDQLYVPIAIRLIALLIVFTVIFAVLFAVIKHSREIVLSNTLAVLLMTIVLPMYLIKDIAVDHNFTFKPIMIMLCSLAFPYVVGIARIVFLKALQIVKGR